MNMHKAPSPNQRFDPLAPAVEIISAFQKTAPIDVDAIAAALGIEVVIDDRLPDDISGKIERVGFFGDRYRITVNGRHARTRQRFTIAHELAHFALHRSLIGDGIVDDAMYRSPRGDDVERQANSYAATILMPAPLVRTYYRGGMKDFASMARTFDVSPDMARIRMRELRLG
ncbi:ImmA/IrrE family metallo-endopeptidase [Xanthobacter sp. KR7-225]|uniref:ImmA/IrrE family metallo-endopeptidase n=1 Tax=Xanthobacter sp. KR7-225 TaxID=3156613 RepID=UPI0032B46A27